LNWLGWLKGRGGDRTPRLVPILTREEFAVWASLESATPPSLRVIPNMPVALFVEGRLPRGVEEEVVPFVGVTEEGRVVRAWFFSPTNGYHFLLSLGIKSELVKPKVSPPPPPRTQEKPEEKTQPEVSPPLQEPEAPPESDSAAPPTDAPPEEKAPVSTETQSDLYKDFAAAWWRGELSAAKLMERIAIKEKTAETKKPSPPKEQKAQKGETPTCPLCNSPMVLKVAKKGKNAGHRFWSCSRYPECKGTRPYRESEP